MSAMHGRPLRVLLVEDEEVIRTEIARVLEAPPANDIVTALPDAATAIRTIEARTKFDVALLDLGLPDGSGVDVIRCLRRVQPQCPPVVLTIYGDAETLFEALRAGAAGYLLKQTAPDRLHAALLEAATGGAPMSPTIAQLVVSSFAQSPPSEETLTRRERDVLTLLARGHTYSDVAKALGLGVGTVQGYVKAIYAKLEISSKAEAAAIAAKLGLV